MKVLDEGIDIPQTDTAFLLASSTVEEGMDSAARTYPAQCARQGVRQPT